MPLNKPYFMPFSVDFPSLEKALSTSFRFFADVVNFIHRFSTFAFCGKMWKTSENACLKGFPDFCCCGLWKTFDFKD